MGYTHILYRYFNSLNRYIVWAADCFLSVVATLLSYLFVHYLLEVDIVPGLAWAISLISFIVSLLWTWICRTNVGVIRHTTLIELKHVVYAMLLKALTLLALSYLYFDEVGAFIYAIILCDFILSSLLLILVRTIVVSFYYYVTNAYTHNNSENVMVYGTSSAAISLANYLQKNKQYHILGFITRDEHWKDYRIVNLPVYYIKENKDLDAAIQGREVKDIFFTNIKDFHIDKELIQYGLHHDLRLRVAPIAEAIWNATDMQMHSVQIEDLLDRDEINVNIDELYSNFAGKTVMVTGAAGSIGSELCRQLCYCGVAQLIIVDFSETAIYRIDLDMQKAHYECVIVSIIADVRNKQRMEYIMSKYKPEVIFHAAAYKHVPLMEKYPCEATLDNLGGTMVVADLAVKHNVEKFIMISTDKAVCPSSVMGATKRLAEMYVQSLGNAIKEGKIKGRTIFVTTRFGNVLGSNGSIIPLFRKQILEGGPVTVTDPNVTRYFMTIPEACRLVLKAACLGEGNDIFIFDMGKPVKIVDLARKMIELSGLRPNEDIQITFTGLRPGEKLYEELLLKKEKTVPTSNPKIYRAMTIVYEFEQINMMLNDLLTKARMYDNIETVKAMKTIIPDYKSMHSDFEQIDKTINHDKI